LIREWFFKLVKYTDLSILRV